MAPAILMNGIHYDIADFKSKGTIVSEAIFLIFITAAKINSVKSNVIFFDMAAPTIPRSRTSMNM
jgi:hypothetical protein